MLNQAAHDIYNAAAEKTGRRYENQHGSSTKHLLMLALDRSKFHVGFDDDLAKFDIWIKAVEDLTAIHRAERGN